MKNTFYVVLFSLCAIASLPANAQPVELRFAAPAPPQSRAAIDKHSGEAFSRRMGNIVESLGNAAKYSVRNLPGHTFDEPSAAELVLWQKQLDPVSAAWVKSTPNGATILSGYREEVKKFRSGR